MSDIDKVCCVCLEAPRTLRFAPCSHANSCETCTIKLIQHALHKQLKCPACQTVVEKLESQFVPPATKAMEAKGEAESRPENAAAPLPPIARQDSYLPSFTSDPASHKLLTIEEFIDSEIASGNEERSALAKSAKEHWNHVPREGELALPPFLRAFARVGGLLLPQPPMPWVRRVCGVLAFLLFSAYVYGIFQVDRARDEFERHVTSLYERGLYVKVTRIDGITGPVNALIPRNDTHHHFDTQGGMCDACINDLLPDPTPHQLWWGLVPRAAVGVVFGPPLAASSVLRARSILYFLSVYFGTMTVAQPLLTVIFDPPGNLYIGHLAGAGVQAMTGMGLMASLYGMYWDEALHLTVINYVPGWAFLWQAVWTFLLAVLTGLMVVRGGRMYTLLFLAGLTYATFWLFIPLVGYTWWFAWEYVDTVAAQEFEQTMVTGAAHGEEAQPLVCLFLRDISFPKLCHRGAVPSSSATHAPFRQTAAMDLGPPFAVCAYGGFACWVVAGLFALGSNWRHLHRLEVDAQYRQQVFIMAANRANLHREERGRLMMGVAMVESRAQERARAAADPSREMV